MTLDRKIKSLFLNIDLGKEFTGIESAAMIRGRIFSQYLNTPSAFITQYFNLNARENLHRYQSHGLAAMNMPIVNMFEWFQGDSVMRQSESEAFQTLTGCVKTRVDGTAHDHRFFKDGEPVAYLKHDETSGRLLFINYLRQGKIWKRDWFTPLGQLTRSEFVDISYDTADAVTDYFWDSQTRPALLREYEFDESKKRTLKTIQRFKNGRVHQLFSGQAECIEAFLEELIDFEALNVFFLDRSREWLEPATRLKAKYPDRIKLVGLLHNTHFVHGVCDPGDPMTSDISSFYKGMLINRHLFDALIVLTDQQRKDIEMRFGDGPYHVIPHAVPHTGDRLEMHRDLYRIVVPGRFAEEKQHHLAIQAFASVCAKVPEASLHFYGYGDKRRVMENEISHLGLENSVFLHPFDPDVQSLYRGAGLSLCSSRNEGFAISVLQALHHGCPVVSFDCHYGPAAMIRDGVNGFLCEPQNALAMANSILQIFLNKPLHLSMIQKAPESVRSFEEDQVAALWAKLLDSLVSGPRSVANSE